MAIAGERLITVLGGSGFLGRHIVRALARRGWRVRVGVRRPDLAHFLQPLGGVGQIHAVQANLRFPDSLAAAMRGADAVVNATGVAIEKGRQSFGAVYAEGARHAAEAAEKAGVASFVQISGLGADAKSASRKAVAAAEGLAALVETLPGAIVLQPSVVFGPEDSFLNRFAALARLTPAMPIFGGAGVRLQPVYVGDVAEAVARALEGGARAGTRYELGGPEVVTMEQVMRFVCDAIGRRRAFFEAPAIAARGYAFVSEIVDRLSFGLTPAEFVLTRDQLALLSADNVVSAAAAAGGRTLGGLGIRPQPISALAPAFLVHYRRAGEFDQRRVA